MKYINQIDDLKNTQTQIDRQYVIARPMQGFGLLKWEIRFRMAWACLTGKADAVTFYKQ